MRFHLRAERNRCPSPTNGTNFDASSSAASSLTFCCCCCCCCCCFCLVSSLSLLLVMKLKKKSWAANLRKKLIVKLRLLRGVGNSPLKHKIICYLFCKRKSHFWKLTCSSQWLKMQRVNSILSNQIQLNCEFISVQRWDTDIKIDIERQRLWFISSAQCHQQSHLFSSQPSFDQFQSSLLIKNMKVVTVDCRIDALLSSNNVLPCCYTEINDFMCLFKKYNNQSYTNIIVGISKRQWCNVFQCTKIKCTWSK